MADTDTTIGDAVTLLESIDLNDLADGALDQLGQRLVLCLHIEAKAREMRDMLELALVESMPEDTLRMGDVTVLRERKTRSSWREGGAVQMRKDVADGVASTLATNVGTGEIDPVARNIMRNAVTEAFKVIAAPQGLKKAGRESLGLRMSNYKNYDDVDVINVIVMEDEG